MKNINIFKLNHEEKKIFDLTVQPFVIFCIIILIISCIGYHYQTLSIEEINGFLKALIIYFLINNTNVMCCEISNNSKGEKSYEKKR